MARQARREKRKEASAKRRKMREIKGKRERANEIAKLNKFLNNGK